MSNIIPRISRVYVKLHKINLRKNLKIITDKLFINYFFTSEIQRKTEKDKTFITDLARRLAQILLRYKYIFGVTTPERLFENILPSSKKPQKPSQAGAWEGVFLSFHADSKVVGCKSLKIQYFIY